MLAIPMSNWRMLVLTKVGRVVQSLLRVVEFPVHRPDGRLITRTEVGHVRIRARTPHPLAEGAPSHPSEPRRALAVPTREQRFPRLHALELSMARHSGSHSVSTVTGYAPRPGFDSTCNVSHTPSNRMCAS